MKSLFRIFWITLGAIVLLMVGLGLTGYFFEERIVQFTLNQLNQKLTIPVKVKEVKVSLIRNFPFAGVTLKNVQIKDGSTEIPDNVELGLLSVDEVVLKMKLTGIFTNNYRIERLLLKDGWINIFFDHNGTGNFEIFKSSEGQKDSWMLELEKLQIRNVNLSYIDPKTGWVSKNYIEKGELEGSFYDGNIFLETTLRGGWGELRQGAFQYVRNEQFRIETIFQIDPEEVVIENGFIDVGGAKLSVNGTIGRVVGSLVQLSVTGEEMSTNKLVQLLLQYNYSLPKKTKTKGNIAFDLEVKGESKMEKPFNIALNFSSKELGIFVPQKPSLWVKNISGTFSNGEQGKPESSSFTINQFTIKTLQSSLEGTLRVKNVNTPLYHLKVHHYLSIPNLRAWDIELPLTGGSATGSVEVMGVLQNLEHITWNSFENSKFIASTSIDDVDFEKVGRIPELQGINGELSISSKELSKGNLKGMLHGSNFEAEIKVAKASSILFNNGKAHIETSIIIDSLNTNWLMAPKVVESNTNGVSAWSRIDAISGEVFIVEFVHEDFTAKPLTSGFTLKEDELIARNFSAWACEGVLSGNMKSNLQQQGSFDLHTHVNMNKINVSALFQSFNNFNQNTIGAENISGELHGELSLKAQFPNGKIDLKTLEATSNLTLRDGKLKDVKQLESLSTYIDVSELKNIGFSTLSNSITIADQTVIIPKMEISSSAINLMALGQHKFNGDYTYQTQINLSELLYKKVLAHNQEFGNVESMDGGGKVYLKIVGDSTTFKVSYDKTMAREGFRESLQTEKEALKEMLKDEFSFLKKKPDSTKTASKDTLGKDKSRLKEEEVKPPKFIIEWDEE